MTRVAILTRQMVMGGIEKALIEMLNIMIEEEYEIDLYLLENGGELLNKVPKKVNVKYVFGKEKSVAEKIKKKLKKFEFIKAIKLLYWYILLIKIVKPKGNKEENYLLKIIEIEKEYDIAIAYTFLYSFGVRVVLDKIQSKKKYLWIHNQTSIFKNSEYSEKYKNYEKFFDKYHKIFCVSKDSKEDFIDVYPNLKNKVELFYNILNKEEIKKLSLEKIPLKKEKDYTYLVTVGRLSWEKGPDRIVEIAENLVKLKYKIKWYLIGDGAERKNLEKKIKKKNLEKNVILLGTLMNPYPYIKISDIYIQPSRHEGYCITLAEAKILNRPIVTTEFAGSFEQIKNYKNGLRVKNSTQELQEGIITLIKNKELRLKFNEELNKENKVVLNYKNILRKISN